MVSAIRRGIKALPKWVFPLFMGIMGIIIIVFNDVFGESETFVIVGLLYFILLFFSLALWLFRQIRFILNLKNEKAKTELLHLKSQVNPHFFFNTLNNLYSLVGSDTEKAKALILKLSDMMRYSIYEGDKAFVTLEEEVEYLQHYIELHQMRYRKHIDVKFDVAIKKGYEIMPLLFLILFENAFKHGVENLRSDAFVHAQLTTVDGSINFEIENNFDPEIMTTPGIGLQNLKRRLELGYPKQHKLHLTQNNGLYKAQLSLMTK